VTAKSIRSLHRVFGKSVGRVTPRWLVEKYRHWTTDVYVVSFPKSGRTWFRTMLGTALQLESGRRDVDPTSVHHLWMFDAGVPRFVFTHDINAHLADTRSVRWDGRRYLKKKTILLVRDPRDTIVSLYFEMTRRVGAYEGTISDFIRQEKGGIASLVAFLNEWMGNLDRLGHGLLISYEDLHDRPIETMGEALRFAGVVIDPDIVARAIELCSFEAMQSMERAGVVQHVRLRPGDVNDPESFKVRSGKVGGYRNHLTTEDCAFIDKYITDNIGEALARYRWIEPDISIETMGSSTKSAEISTAKIS